MTVPRTGGAGPARAGAPAGEAGLVAAALLAVAIWGGSPAATKLALADVSPVDVAMLRTLVGFVPALPLVLLLRLPLPADRARWRLLALSAACGFLGFPLLFSFGQRATSVTHATLILAFLPVLTAGYAMAWDRRRPTLRFLAGCATALAGEAVLVLGRTPAGGPEASLWGDLLVLASGASSSFGYVAGARLARAGYPSTATTFWGIALASIVLLPLAPDIVGRLAADPPAPAAWAGILFLGLGSTVAAYLLWYRALARGGIGRMGLTQFLQPLVGVALALALFGEPIGPTVGIATLLILAGTALARRGIGT